MFDAPTNLTFPIHYAPTTRSFSDFHDSLPCSIASSSRRGSKNILLVHDCSLFTTDQVFFDLVDELQQHVSLEHLCASSASAKLVKGINMQDILKLKVACFLFPVENSLTCTQAAAINTVSGVNMTTRRQLLKIKVWHQSEIRHC